MKPSKKALEAVRKKFGVRPTEQAHEYDGLVFLEDDIVPLLETAYAADQDENSRKLRADCRNAFRAIAEALAEPAGGSYHHARKILDAHDIYHDDLEGLRVLRVLAELMLSKLGGRVTHGTTRKVGK